MFYLLYLHSNAIFLTAESSLNLFSNVMIVGYCNASCCIFCFAVMKDRGVIANVRLHKQNGAEFKPWIIVHYQHPWLCPRGGTEENEECYVTVACLVPTFEQFTSPKVKLVTAVLICPFLYYWPQFSARLIFSVSVQNGHRLLAEKLKGKRNLENLAQMGGG
jgi:hypothetical protein